MEISDKVFALKAEGRTNGEIAELYGLTRRQVVQLVNRERRKERKIAAGYIPQPKGRRRKTPESEEEQRNNEVIELRMKVELLQNFLSEVGRR